MAVPFLILGAAGIAALTGVGAGANAIHKNHKAKDINEEAQSIVKSAKNSATRAKNKSGRMLEELGKTKLVVLDGTMKSFVKTFEKIHSIEFVESRELKELSKYHIDKQQLTEMKEMGNMATTVLGGLVGGAGAGALTAFGAYGATMTFATASTGTAIASLSGVAATNATLAFLGGGSLAAGGLGMAGGTMVLGGVVAGPALCILGIVMNASASKNLDNAYSNLAEAKAAAESLRVVATLCKSITQRAELFISLLNCLERKFSQLTIEMERITSKSGYNYKTYTEDEQKVIVEAMAMAKAVKQVLDTPILTESGAVTEVSQRVYDAVSAQYNGAERINTVSGKTTAVSNKTLKNSSMNYKRALTAALYFFAKCDGSVSDEECAVLDQYVSVLNNTIGLTTEQRLELEVIRDTNFAEFEQIAEFLDKVTSEELQQIKELVRKLIIASDGINDAEKKEYFKFIHYDTERTK